MKNIFLALLATIITVTSNGQTSDNILIGKADSIYSGILKEKRKVLVYVPNMKTGMQTASQRYSVVYFRGFSISEIQTMVVCRQ